MKRVLVMILLATAWATQAQENEQPNLVIILVDDMGWNDPGYAGNPDQPTPNIDRMAREGLVFQQAYSAAPNCAPTRACLMTGQYTPRHGVYTVVDERHAPGRAHHRIIAADSRSELPAGSVTIAEVLRDAGYRTAMIGMWNLGRGRQGPATPTGQGFDVYVQPGDMGFDKDAYWNKKGEYLTDRLTDAAIDFITERSSPFFLYLAYHAVHAPFDPKPELAKKYGGNPGRTAYAATLDALDQNIGRLLASLPRNTLVVFTSDNGGVSDSVAPLRGGKGTLYEGGVRVPMVLWGRGITGDRSSDTPVSTVDIFPTLLEAAGIAPPKDVPCDGRSLVPLWNGRPLDRDALFWHFPCYAGRGTPSSALRKGPYKLIEFFETGEVELYDLSRDESERHDLSREDPRLTRSLHAELKAVQSALQAPLPTAPNPDYDPTVAKQHGRPPETPKVKP